MIIVGTNGASGFEKYWMGSTAVRVVQDALFHEGGLRPQILLEALERAGASFTETDQTGERQSRITKADLYARGFSGKSGSVQARKQLLQKLGLPERLTADGLLDVLNALMSREAFYEL